MGNYDTIFHFRPCEINAQELDIVVKSKAYFKVIWPYVAQPVTSITILHLVHDVVTDLIETLALLEAFYEGVFCSVV